MEASAYLAYDDDIRNRTIGQWMGAHTTFGKPLHRYEGEIGLLSECILFKGKDNMNGEQIEIVIPRHRIQQVYHGFDHIFTISESRSLGLTWKPLRLTVREGKERFIYLIIDYSYGFTNNGAWYEYLQEWTA